MKTENLKNKVLGIQAYFVTGAFPCVKLSKQEEIQHLH